MQKKIINVYVSYYKYPQSTQHIIDVMSSRTKKGLTNIYRIDRPNKKKHRTEALKGIPTKKHYDRDEFPMAFLREGGKGSDIRYILPSDNRGCGSFIGNTVKNYPDGTYIRLIIVR